MLTERKIADRVASVNEHAEKYETYAVPHGFHAHALIDKSDNKDEQRTCQKPEQYGDEGGEHAFYGILLQKAFLFCHTALPSLS